MDRRHIVASLLLSLPLAVQAAGPTGAVELYRYIDRNGTPVIDRQGVPPEYAGKGYDVLNEQGRVIRSVAPALPAEELQRREQARQQAASDAQLLKLYSTAADVDRAKARKLAELDGIIQSKQSNLVAAQNLQGQLMEQAAVQQRNGQELSDEFQARLKAAAADQVRLKADVERYTVTRSTTSASFDADRARMQRLDTQHNQ